MAKVKWSMMDSDFRGKLNGSKFGKGRSAHVAMNKVKGTNPRTSAQGSIRTFFRQLTVAWKTLTSAQILSWNSAASNTTKKNVFGDAYRTTGHKLYLALNLNALKNGGTVVSTPPTLAVPAIVDISTLVLTAAGGVVSLVTSIDIPTGCKLLVTATKPVSNGKTNLNGLYRKIDLQDAPFVAGVLSLTAAYAAVFGTITAGQKIGFRVYTVGVGGFAQYKANHDLIGQVV